MPQFDRDLFDASVRNIMRAKERDVFVENKELLAENRRLRGLVAQLRADSLRTDAAGLRTCAYCGDAWDHPKYTTCIVHKAAAGEVQP